MKNVFIISFILIACFIGFKNCVPNIVDKSIQISQGKEVSITPQIKKIIPNAEIAFTHTPIKSEVGKKIEETIVVTKDKKIDIISTVKNDFGLYRGVGAFVGLNVVNGWDAGLCIYGPFYSRIQSGCLIGFRNGGIMLGGRTTENSLVGVHYSLNYQSLTPNFGLFVSLGF